MNYATSARSIRRAALATGLLLSLLLGGCGQKGALFLPVPQTQDVATATG